MKKKFLSFLLLAVCVLVSGGVWAQDATPMPKLKVMGTYTPSVLNLPKKAVVATSGNQAKKAPRKAAMEGSVVAKIGDAEYTDINVAVAAANSVDNYITITDENITEDTPIDITGNFATGATFYIAAADENKVNLDGTTIPDDAVWDDTYANSEKTVICWKVVPAVEGVEADGTKKKYPTLVYALYFTGEGGTINLLSDVTLTENDHLVNFGNENYATFYYNANITLDLKGHTVNMPNHFVGMFSGNESTLTIKDSSTDGTGTFIWGTNQCKTAIYSNGYLYFSSDILHVEGGSYNADVADYLPEGYEEKMDATTSYYKVSKIPYACSIGEVKYTYLSDAIAAVKTGETIELMRDNSETIILPLGVTIHFNSHSHGTINVDANCILNTATTDYVSSQLRVATDKGNVASSTINNVTYYYNTLQAAANAAAEINGTVELLVNNTEAILLPAGVTINLNDKTHGAITAANGYVLVETSTSVSSRMRTAQDGSNIATVLDGATTYYCTTFEEALDIANATTGATVTLLDNYAYPTNGTGLWNITSSMTIDGANKTLTGYGSLGTSKANTTLAINYHGENTIEVSLKNLTVNNTSTGTARSIDVREHVSKLTLDNCAVNAVGSGNNQGITIIGTADDDNHIINITNSSIHNLYNGNGNGYAIITFAPVTMTIDNSNIVAWSALYFKGETDDCPGAAGSVVTIQNGSYLEGYNAQDGGQNYFGTIVCEDGGITVNATNCTIKAVAASKNVTNSVFCNSSYNFNYTDNTFNIGTGCKIDLTTYMRYFVMDDSRELIYYGTSYMGNAIVNLLEGSLYNFIPVDQYVYNSITYSANANTGEVTDLSKPTHIACQEGMGVMGSDNTAYPYTIGALTAPNPYAIVAYKGDEEEHDIDKVDATSWEAQVAAKPNTVGIISGETYDAVTATAFAKSTDNIVVKYPVGDDDYAYVAPTFNVTDLTAEGIGTDYDKTDYYSPETFTATKGGFSRQLYSGCNSVCVPFDVDVNNTDLNGLHTHEILTYSSYSQVDGTVYFTYADHVDAGVPFIVLLQNNREWKVDFNNTEIIGKPESVKECAGVFQTTGDYGENEKGYYSVTSTGTFGVLADKLYPFRACFQLEGATAGAAPRLGVLNAGQVTYADELIAGKGITDKFMKNGRLYIRHNGQVYDAAGQLVK